MNQSLSQGLLGESTPSYAAKDFPPENPFGAHRSMKDTGNALLESDVYVGTPAEGKMYDIQEETRRNLSGSLKDSSVQGYH